MTDPARPLRKKLKLIIFDLDQTLVDSISVHDKATSELFKRCFGVDARLTEIDFAGKSLKENFIELAKLKGIPENQITQNSDKLLKNYEHIFDKMIPQDFSKYILPGVKELLQELSRTENLVVLYTGDSPVIVKTVLRATGLEKYFKFSWHGTETKTRADMVRLAIEKAQRLTGKTFKNKDVVIIGDSIRDIEAGRQFNALTIAVATGFHTVEELSKNKPDYLFRNMEDFRQILNIVR